MCRLKFLLMRIRKQEYEAYLKDYDIKNNNCTIKAGTSGYFYTNKEISNGTYIQEGDSIGQIYPKEQSGYYAQVYVENSDIAKIKPDQEVKLRWLHIRQVNMDILQEQ